MRFAAGLQAAVFARLAGDAALAALVGGAIYDAPPALAPDASTDYVTLGEETRAGERHQDQRRARCTTSP